MKGAISLAAKRVSGTGTPCPWPGSWSGEIFHCTLYFPGLLQQGRAVVPSLRKGKGSLIPGISLQFFSWSFDLMKGSIVRPGTNGDGHVGCR